MGKACLPTHTISTQQKSVKKEPTVAFLVDNGDNMQPPANMECTGQR